MSCSNFFNCAQDPHSSSDTASESDIVNFIVRGKRRLYSVPEAPDLPDSEAFIRDVERSSWSHRERLNDLTTEGEGEGERGECSPGSASKEPLSPSVLLPWKPEEDLVWEGQNKRPRLFGDLGQVEEGGGGEEGGKIKVKPRSLSTSSSSTPSRNDIYHSNRHPVPQSLSTTSPLPPPSFHTSPHPTTLSKAHNSTIGSTSADNSPATNKGI